MLAKLLQSCPTLCNPIDSSPPGSAIPGILQARTLEWVAIFFSNAWKWKVKVKSLSHDPMDCSPPGSAVHATFQARVLEWVASAFSQSMLSESHKVLLTQSCLTLYNPMDCSPPGSFVHGILQARIVEWVAISFSRRSSRPRDQPLVSCITGRFFTIWTTREAQCVTYSTQYSGISWKK